VIARAAAWASVVVLALAPSALAADPSRPHGHRGVLAPFAEMPKPVVLSPAERTAVERGDVLLREMAGRKDGRRQVVFTVEAPPERVWAVIANFAAFPRYIDEVKSAVVVEEGADGTVVAFTVSQAGVTLTYYVRHRYDAAQHEGTWTLDYSKESDLDDSIGYWRVTPLAGGTRSLVEHSTHVALKTPLPGFLRDWIADNSLRGTGGWVRKHVTAAPKR
jgi:hypothetical protein